MSISSGVVRKHVTLIHVFSSMSCLQRKILNVLVSECNTNNAIPADDMADGREFVISLSTLLSKTKFNSKNTTYFKEAIDSLASLKVEWNLLKDRAPSDISFLNLRLLHGSPTFRVDGTVQVSFHKFSLRLLESPDIYGTIDLDVQCDFESKYSHSLYENCTRFVNMNKGKIIQLDTFRKALSVPINKFESMREFNRNVLLVAQEEVNDRADFTVQLKKVKTGRKVTALELNVVRKQKAVVKNNKAVDKESKICQEVKSKFPNIKDRILDDILSRYSTEYIKEKIDYTIFMKKPDVNNNYPLAYFISALKDDYKLSSKKNNSKEQIVSTTKNNRTNWNFKHQLLISNLNHWLNNLKTLEQKMNPGPALENVKNIVNKCKEELKSHKLTIDESRGEQ